MQYWPHNVGLAAFYARRCNVHDGIQRLTRKAHCWLMPCRHRPAAQAQAMQHNMYTALCPVQIGILHQEPKLDESASVLDNIQPALEPVKQMVKEFEEVCPQL